MKRFGFSKILTGSLAAGFALAAAAGLWFVQGTASAAAAAPQPSLAGTWNVDPMHTSVSFTITHMGISKVPGRFTDLAGTIVADPAHVAKSSVQFTIQATSVDTQVAARDTHLRSKDFFDVAQYPTITFESTKIVKVKGNQYRALGNLTMHGTTRPIVLPFTVAGPVEMMGTSRIGLTTQITLKRSDYGVGDPKFAAVLGDNVDVVISLEAVAAKKS
ncbi:MAG: YceI family protein [Capsulimonadaceae bacterium]|nr:YceI family protein [Capsulimonadaceae bacterium]